MITVYTFPSSLSSRKARNWFIFHQIPFQEKNFFIQPLTNEELKKMLQMSENGVDDILSKNSKIYKSYAKIIYKLTMYELLKLMKEHPSILRKPIIIDEYRMLVGFNEDEIRVFLPKKIRKQELKYALLLAGI